MIGIWRVITWRSSTIVSQKEYNQETYAWSYWEAECDAWYMDSCHFWDENHFHILFDDSTPPSVEHILESRQEPSMHTLLQFSYSPVLMDDFLAGSTYLDPHDQCRSWEHHFQLAIEFHIFNVEFT
jgi:hypothetical protein